ncbi:MAG: class I SAM-dependent methyltransferase [Halioglobus sp.]
MYTYNQAFYQYINQGSLASAEVVVDALQAILPQKISSVLDVGCGAGAWLSVWKARGAAITGLDGDYVQRDALLIDADEFRSHDLATPFALETRFDLAQSLEVAEHLPQSAADNFVASLCASADLVLFSAAAPGQGGENHINEQPYEYWQALFDAQGYTMYDAIRDQVLENKNVMPWYRFNTFIYVKRGVLPRVHAAMAHCELPLGHVPADKSPKLYQLRKRLIWALPVKQRTQIAVLKKRLQNTR